jgi:AraC-like DNA-binding protein
MGYEEFPAPPRLAPFVRCAWAYRAAASERRHAPERIVPDGRCELIVHLGDPFAESDGAGPERIQPRALFAGQLSRPLWLRATGAAHVLGVRFHAAGARRFLGMPLWHATDKRIPFDAALSPGPRGLADVLEFVEARIAGDPLEIDSTIAESAAALEAENGNLALDALIAASGLGRRQFERRFRDAVGLSPRLFANVLRLRSVFDALHANPREGWTDAALAAGYFDQSHFIRDFRRFVGCTPSRFCQEAEGLAVAIVQSGATSPA